MIAVPRRLLLSEIAICLFVVYGGIAILSMGMLSPNFVLGMSMMAGAGGVALSVIFATSRRRERKLAQPMYTSQRQLERRLAKIAQDSKRSADRQLSKSLAA